MKLLCSIAALVMGVAAFGSTTDYPAPRAERGTLTLYSTTDIAAFESVILDFQELHPHVSVRYELLDSGPLYARFLRETRERRPQADLLLSASMDLQVKLVNDGYAAPHVSASSLALPSWARWRNEAFGFTFEPVVMVFNRGAMMGKQVPRSRGELLEMLKLDPEYWRGRVGTYDISRSNVGYLLASQDVRHSSEFGALVEAFYDTGVRVEVHSSTLLKLLEAGELAIGYNMLSSYAQARIDSGAPLVIVYPQDYTLVMSRTAVIPRNAPNIGNAHLFLEHLLSLRGQRMLAAHSNIAAVRTEARGAAESRGGGGIQVGPLRPISLGPGLLVYLDAQKRQRTLASWRGIIQLESSAATGY